MPHLEHWPSAGRCAPCPPWAYIETALRRAWPGGEPSHHHRVTTTRYVTDDCSRVGKVQTHAVGRW